VRWPVLVLLVSAAARAAPCDELPLLATHGRIVIRGELTRAQQNTAFALVDGVVADVARRFGAGPAKPVTLCLLGESHRYMEEAATFGDIPSEWGFYRPDLRIAIANVGQSIGNLRHELVHPLIGDDFSGIPAWLNEGIASLYGTARPTKAGFEFLVNYRLRDLHRAMAHGELPTLAELATSTDEDVRGHRAPTFYAMSRYVLLYVDRRGQLGALYAALRDASGDRDAQRAVLEKFVDERAFRAWAAKLKL
jgi:hypothetical protein